jgi:hypothetical protein
MVLVGDITSLPALLGGAGTPNVCFDAVVGRNVLTRRSDKVAVLTQLRACLGDGGRLALAEIVPRRAQRLAALVESTAMDSVLMQRWQEAEAALYDAMDEPHLLWDVSDVEAALHTAGFHVYPPLRCETHTEERRITAAVLERWFAMAVEPPSYAQRLRAYLTAEELLRIETCLRHQVGEQIVPWQTALVYITVTAGRGETSATAM